jgi:integral membrane protein
MALPLRQFFNNMDYKLLKRFCMIATLEGISYLLLLGVAMPLKYFWDKPEFVKYTGWAHGVLFVAYAAMLIMCWAKYKWSFGKAALIFLASLLPVAPFIVERKLMKEALQNA